MATSISVPARQALVTSVASAASLFPDTVCPQGALRLHVTAQLVCPCWRTGLAAAALAAPLLGHTPRRLAGLAFAVGSVVPLTAAFSVLGFPVGLEDADTAAFDPQHWGTKVRQQPAVPAQRNTAHTPVRIFASAIFVKVCICHAALDRMCWISRAGWQHDSWRAPVRGRLPGVPSCGASAPEVSQHGPWLGPVRRRKSRRRSCPAVLGYAILPYCAEVTGPVTCCRLIA